MMKKHRDFRMLITSIVLSLFCCINSYAQEQHVTMKVKNTSLKDVFKEIEKQTTYRFSYRNGLLDDRKDITISRDNASVPSVLDEAFKGRNLDYKIISSKMIVISEKQKEVASAGILKKVIGVVKDEKGETIIGANVRVVGINTGTITDIDGNFSFEAPIKGKLEISYIGYQRQVVAIGNNTSFNIIMKEDSKTLDEVVVVGYGIQKKVNLTGAVSSIDYADQVAKRPVINIGSSLAGMSAGLQVMQTGGGQPGSDNATIRIRGNGTLNSNAPLVLVDGMECNLGDVNPNDIASISILKDAGSTAIYGSRGANGVILVITKKGSADKVSVSYSYSGIIQNAYNDLKYDNSYSRYMSLMNEACDNIGTNRIFSNYNIKAWAEAESKPNELAENGLPNYMVYPNTDWFDEVFNTGFSQEHNLSISGGSSKVRYLISTGYLDNKGVINSFGLDSGIKKINFRTNIEANPFNWLKVGTRIFGQQLKEGMANVSNGFKFLYITTPGIYIGEPNKWGMIANEAEESSGANNVIQAMYGATGDNTSYKFNGTVYGAITPFSGLSLEGSANFIPTFGTRSSYGRPNASWNYAKDAAQTKSDLANATITNGNTKSLSINTELIARYNTNFNKSEHDLGVLLGYTTSHYETEGFSVQKKGATDWSLDQLSTYELLLDSGSSYAEWALRSYFGRINYAYKDRYLFEANMRIDGSSRFAAESRYGYFPSFSAGWRLSEENFMKKYTNLNNLKIRASWGQTGNNASGNYDWQALYSAVNIVMGGNPTKGVTQSKAANPRLKWETTTTTNLGIDFGVYNNTLSGSLDVYNKFTEGILFTPSPYMTMGTVPGATQNIAQVRNRGLELSLTYMNKIGRDFNFSATANFAYNINKVLKYKGKLQEYWTYDSNGNKLSYISNKGDVSEGGFGGLICEGHPIGEKSTRRFYQGTGAGYKGGTVDPNAGPKDGMIRTEADMEWVKSMMAAGYKFAGVNSVGKDKLWYGDLLYQDYNGDGNYGNANDMYFTGHTSMPKINAGLNIAMNWKGLDLSMVWSGAFGFYLNWNNAYNRSTINYGQAALKHVADNHYFYDPGNPEDSRTNIYGKYPRLTYGTGYNNTVTSDWYEYKGDYIKLKNFQIGYSLPKKYINKILLTKLRAFVSMDNILTITNYPGMDPEIGEDMKYPLMKQVAFGIQASF